MNSKSPSAFEGKRSSPRFGDPLSWSVPVLRLGGTVVRAHAILLADIGHFSLR